ncbi:MAG TPA: toxin-activating lysine-acyltransferase [Aliiroseovarius sp.]|nr:toxin-activating lysine-acyltransferase [Aliiroseovarius sp.]
MCYLPIVDMADRAGEIANYLPPLPESDPERPTINAYRSLGAIPTAMATWAWLSEETERDVHATGRALNEDEWNCGKRLFFNDWITPYGNIREVLHDMTHNTFPNEVATSLRRNPDGSVRRINRWTGVNLRKAREGVLA